MLDHPPRLSVRAPPPNLYWPGLVKKFAYKIPNRRRKFRCQKMSGHHRTRADGERANSGPPLARSRTPRADPGPPGPPDTGPPAADPSARRPPHDSASPTRKRSKRVQRPRLAACRKALPRFGSSLRARNTHSHRGAESQQKCTGKNSRETEVDRKRRRRVSV